MKETSLIRYRGSIPIILRYRIITKILLVILAGGLRYIRGAVLFTSTRSAVSSGDLPFLMTSVQGWTVILMGAVLLVLYVIFDVNAMIILSSRILHQQPVRVREIMRDAFFSMKLFRKPFGIFMLLYVAFLVPLVQVGMGISLTEKFYIPDFVMSVIKANALYYILYIVGLLAICVVSALYIFTFHCIIIGGADASRAGKRARRLMQKNWKDFLVRYGKFLIKSFLIWLGIVAGTAAVLFGVAVFIDRNTDISFRVLLIFSSFLVLTVAEVYGIIFTSFQFLQLTRIYESYTEEDEGEHIIPRRALHWKMTLVTCAWIAFLIIGSFTAEFSFDEVFPEIGNTQVIAHRAGGKLGNENTVYGLERAIEQGADAGEIDVQRTKDGYYILNHDNTFSRVAGVNLAPGEMTLEEIRKLSVEDEFNFGASGQPVATFEEILDAARGRIHLYVELKGSTADKQMADDLYRIVAEKNMLDSVTFITLKYPLVSYMETKYRDADTGYLCYASVGNLEDLDADKLIIEEELATPDNIEKVHAAGKQVIVWTVNSQISMVRFYSRTVDAVITDEVNDALNVRGLLTQKLEDELAEFEEEYDDIKRVILGTVFVLWP